MDRSGVRAEGKKLWETSMDSCLPNAGAEEDSFEWTCDAPAWGSHWNSITTGQGSFTHVQTAYHAADTQTMLRDLLTCFQIQLWANLRGHLWCNPIKKERKKDKMFYFTWIRKNRQSDQGWGALDFACKRQTAGVCWCYTCLILKLLLAGEKIKKSIQGF